MRRLQADIETATERLIAEGRAELTSLGLVSAKHARGD